MKRILFIISASFLFVALFTTKGFTQLPPTFWANSFYMETYQNGIGFGTGKVLSVLNDVITFDDKRLDDRNKDIFYQEDFEGASVSFTCGTDLTAADETAAPIKGTSKSFTQGATPPAVGIKCESAAITLSPKEQDKNIVEVCFNSEWNGNNNEMALNVYGNTSAANLVQVPITASSTPKKHCGYFTTSGEASIDYHIEVLTQNANKILLIDSVQFKVDPLAATDLYASSEWSTPETLTFDAVTSAPTKGTTSIDEVRYRRDGKDLIAVYTYRQSAAGSAGSGAYLVRLPDSLSADSSIVNFATAVQDTGDGDVVGKAFLNDGATGLYCPSEVVMYDSTRFYVQVGPCVSDAGTANGTTGEFFSSGSFGLDSTELIFKATIRVPIAGWSDTAQGVVVRGAISSDVGESPIYSALIAADGSVSKENVDFINGNCTNADPRVCTTTFTASDNFNCVGSNEDITATSTNTISIDNNVQATFLFCTKSTDYSKESERTLVLPEGLYQNTCYVKDVKAVGTNGGSSSAGQNTRVLNTTSGNCSFLSLSSNQVTLEAGSYDISCSVPSFRSGATKGTWYNTGTTNYDIIGTASYSDSASSQTTAHSEVKGNINISSSTTYELRHYISIATATNGLGVASGVFGDEVFSQCEITKVR